jgi:hypothetical protein
MRDQLLVRLDQRARCPLGWIPSVFAPVFHGYRDHQLSLPPPDVVATEARIAFAGTTPVPAGWIEVACRVFYPTLDGSPQDAPPLIGCGFSHGQCAVSQGKPPSDFYKAWYDLPATLARAGYVVVVPRFEAPNSEHGVES